MKKRIYLDYNATTPVDPQVQKAMLPFFINQFGNASSLHEFGRTAKMAIEDARDIICNFLDADDANDIVFTSGGTESDNFAIKGTAYALREKGKHIITSSIEHQAVLNTCKYLEEDGFRVTYLPVDEHGIVDLDALKDAIDNKTILVSIMLANNEVGTIQPVEEISKMLKSKGIVFHTDAVQGIGKMPVSVKQLGVDLLSFSAHKFYGPKGAGGLYVKKGTRIVPFQHGGHHERSRRAGTENVPGIAGLGRAAELLKKNMKRWSKKINDLRDKLHRGLENQIGLIKLNGHPVLRLPNTLNLSFKYAEGESLLINLDLKGIAASTGSACTSGNLEPSHVLRAMGVEPRGIQGSIRFSLGKDNTEEEIKYVLKVMPSIVEKLRRMSPHYQMRVSSKGSVKYIV